MDTGVERIVAKAIISHWLFSDTMNRSASIGGIILKHKVRKKVRYKNTFILATAEMIPTTLCDGNFPTLRRAAL